MALKKESNSTHVQLRDEMPRETEVITQWKLKKIQGNLGSLSKSKEAEAGLPTPTALQGCRPRVCQVCHGTSRFRQIS